MQKTEKPRSDDDAEGLAMPDPFDVAAGAELRNARLSRGFSLGELGRALWITPQQVQKYERGANRLSVSMLIKAARILEVEPARLLLGDSGESAKAWARDLLGGPAELAELVENYGRITSPALRRAVLRTARLLAASKASGAIAKGFPAGHRCSLLQVAQGERRTPLTPPARRSAAKRMGGDARLKRA